MTPWLQVVLGFLPVIAVLTAVVIAKKFKSSTAIISWLLTAGLCAGAAACAVAGVPYISGTARKSDPEPARTAATAKADDHLELAYAMMERGEYDEAARILDGYLDSFPYSDKYILASARLHVLTGDLEAAGGLYGLLNGGDGEDAVMNPQKAETAALVNCLASSGSWTSWQDLVDRVRDVAADITENASEDVLGAVTAWENVNRLANRGAHISDEERKAILVELKTWSEGLNKKGGSGLKSVPFISGTALRAAALTGDFQGVLESVSENTDADGLLITAELINAGAITNEDVRETDSFSDLVSDSSAVRDWAKDQLKNGSFTEEERKVIEDILDELAGVSESPKLASEWIENEILKYIEEHPGADTSKLWLELAKLAFADGDTAAASVYLQRALGEAGNSTDSDYAGAARELLDVIRNPEDTEARKKVPELVRRLTQGVKPDVVDAAVELNPPAAEEVPPEDEPGQDPEKDPEGPSMPDLWGGFRPGESTDPTEPEEPTEPEDPGISERPGDNVPDEPQPDLDEGFDQYVTDTVNQSAGSVSILSVDASDFDTIRAVVSVDETLASTAEEFQAILEISDCSTRIRSYEVEKLNYTEVNIALVCDNSGSMSGDKIENLKQALRYFVGITDDVNIAIVPFSSGVGNVKGFGSDNKALLEGIEDMRASGGTNISYAVTHALGLFPNTPTALNVLIVMSDGQDSEPSQTTVQTIKAACAEKNVAIYAMGLGADVDSRVMNSYARVGGGAYMYVSDAASLQSFYDYIYKLCMNRFLVTYTAIDTVKTTRRMSIRAVSATGVQDEVTYYLTDSDVSGDDLGESYDVSVDSRLTLSGLESRLMYRCGVNQVTYLLGSGFTKDDEIEVELSGGVSYKLTTEYLDGGRIRVTVPASAACGVYDVFVTVNGRRWVFNSGFVMSSRDRKSVRFGDYVFTGTDVYENNGVITLSGIVDMNGWLNFTGDVTIKGNVEEDYSVLLSFSGGYVQYFDDGTATGLAKYYAENSLILSVPDVHDVRIYNDVSTPADSEDYPAGRYYAAAAALPVEDFVRLVGLGEYVYPNRIELDFDDISLNLPYLKAVITGTKSDDLFTFKNDHSQKLVLKQDAIGLNLEVKWKARLSGTAYTSLGNMNITVKNPEAELKLDTLKGEASIKFAVDVSVLTDGVGLELGWKDWKFDTLKLYADADIDTHIGGVPVTFSDFMLGVTDLSKVERFTVSELAKAKLTGAFDCSLAKVSSVFPGLEKYLEEINIEDPAVATLDNTTVEFRLNQFYISVSTKAKLFNLLELANAKLELGSGISYTNTILEMDNESVSGIVGKVSVGPHIDTKYFKLTATGSVLLAMTDKVFGVTVDGEIDVDISWWIISVGTMTKGELFLGIYRQHSSGWQFVVYATGHTKDGSSMKPLCWPTDALSSRKF